MEKIVFHGTYSDDIEKIKKSILKNGFTYKRRENHWFGQGIYFFDEYEWAVMWANQKRNSESCIIQAKIFCDDKEFLNLDLVSSQKMVADCIKEINKELKEKLYTIIFNDDNQKRCFYLDIIKENRNFKIIKHTFNLPNKNRITKEIGIELSQIQFCVSSNDNICDITIKEENKRILKAKKRLIIGWFLWIKSIWN